MNFKINNKLAFIDTFQIFKFFIRQFRNFGKDILSIKVKNLKVVHFI